MDQVTLLFPQIEMKKEGKEYGKALKKKKNQITEKKKKNKKKKKKSNNRIP